jgi:transposase
MSTSLLYNRHGAKSLIYLSRRFFDGAEHIYTKIKDKYIVCPLCKGNNVIKKGVIDREIISLPTGNKPSIIHVKVNRVLCKDCMEIHNVDIGFCYPYKSYSKQFAKFIIQQIDSSCIATVAKKFNITESLCFNIYVDHLKNKYGNPVIKNLHYIAIDEIAIFKKHKYLTIVLDLETKTIIYVGDGKSSEALDDFWAKIGPVRAANIKGVSIDMSGAYIKAVTENVPNAILVFDHFHVIKHLKSLVNELRIDLLKKADNDGKNALLGTMWVLRKDYGDLNIEEQEKLKKALEFNNPLYELYMSIDYLKQLWKLDIEIMFKDKNNLLVDLDTELQIKEKYTQRLKDKDAYVVDIKAKSEILGGMSSDIVKKEAKKFLDRWTKLAIFSDNNIIRKAGQFIDSHSTGILNWFSCHINSGPIEGLNNKIKLLKRQMYGIGNVEYFKLRLYGLHDTKIINTGG